MTLRIEYLIPTYDILLFTLKFEYKL